MNQFELAIVVMAVTDTRRGPRDADGRRRQLTTDQLDALADFEWRWAGVQRSLVAWASAVLSSLCPRASSHLDPAPLPSAEATAHG